MPANVLRSDTQKVFIRRKSHKTNPLRERISFKNKIPLRNMGRNKIRTIMGIIGIWGCMAMLITGFGLRDSLSRTNDAIYEDLYLYENKIITTLPFMKNEFFQESDKAQYAEEHFADIKSDSKKSDIVLIVYEKGDYIQLVDAENETIAYQSQGIIISESLAALLEVDIDDTIQLLLPEEEWIRMKVAAICSEPLANTAYMSKDAYEMSVKAFSPTIIMSGNTDIDLEEIKKHENVEQVIKKEDQATSLRKSLENTDSIVYLLIMVSIALGTTIIINLGLLNYSEMMRDYATLKVIGLYPVEIRFLALRENIALTLIGLILGVPGGILALQLYLNIVSGKNLVFYAEISPLSYGLALSITFICSIGVNILLSLKLTKIDMVSSLKSDE